MNKHVVKNILAPFKIYVVLTYLVNLPFDYKSVSDIFGCLFSLKIYLDANPNIVLDYHAETHADAPVYCVFGLFSRGRINKNAKVLKYLT